MIDKKKTINYVVIRKALSKELCDFIYNYMLIQRDAVDLMMKHNQLNPYNPFMGTREDKQIPGAYSKYGDWAMEALLVKMIPIMKKKTGLELIPTYSYTRLYEKGNILKRHKDRPSCEVEHWREPFQGNICSQVFLHYNHANGPYAKTNLLDTRPILGVPHLPSK